MAHPERLQTERDGLRLGRAAAGDTRQRIPTTKYSGEEIRPLMSTRAPAGKP
jgi:hypothetical protein